MGIGASAPVNPEGLGNAIYDQNDDQQIISASVYSLKGCKAVNQDSAVLCQVIYLPTFFMIRSENFLHIREIKFPIVYGENRILVGM